MLRLRVRRLIPLLITFVVGAIFSSIVAFAWTGPTQTAPNGNVAAPINVGTTDQIKNAGLGVNSLAVFGNSILEAASYLNWGSVSGSSGYGIRDNAGALEFKSSGGAWRPVFASSGGFSVPTSATVTVCNSTLEATQRYNATSKQMEFCNGTTWTAFGGSGGGGGGGTTFIISANAQNVNLYTFAGNPGAVADYAITVNPGVIIGSSNASNPSMTTGVWPAGSTVTLINNGMIYGKGGDGKSFFSNGSGGTAISLDYNLTINNTNGAIGGGGGGGGAGGSSVYISCQEGSSSPGGGGGGQGSLNSNTSLTSGNGGQGTATAPGAGGSPTNYCGGSAGWGGSGGTLGNPGANGSSGSGGSGATGGAAGKAILLNAKTVTWLGGNNATQVKGAVQ